jgi:hypothetical protein
MLHSDTMKTVKVILITIITLSILGATALFLVGYFKPTSGGIKIDTVPVSNVYINDVFVGKSPYEGTYPKGIISLKLIPESSGQNLIPFETKITLASGIQTVISRDFGSTEDNSSGYVISFEKTGGSEAGLIVISRPDNAQILTDGVSRGFTPYKALAITPAMHQITARAPGYIDKTVMVKTMVGYRLTFYAKLAIDEATSQISGENNETKVLEKTFVEISDTPTGFLRVRTKPGTSGEEIAEVIPGSRYPFLDEDAETGWFLIQYQEPKSGLPAGITGWVSKDFAKKVILPDDSTTSASIN